MFASLLTAALMALPAHAGDLWLEVRADAHDDEVRVEVPANWLLDVGEPIEVSVEGRQYDLRAVARAAKARREGTRIQLRATDEQGQPYDLAVEHRREQRREGPAPRVLTLDLQGGDGHWFQIYLPLVLGEGALTLAAEGFHADVELDGLEIPWEAEAFLAQLRAAPPTALVEVLDETGCGVVIRTE
jgi:hypothetical protein